MSAKAWSVGGHLLTAQQQQTLQLIGGLGLAWTLMEVAAHMLLKPFFMHLLDGNPKLAGQQQKKQSTAAQMCPRAVCFVHNLLQIPLGLLILTDPFFNQNMIWARSDLSSLVMAISAGYFLYDTFECILRLEHEGWDFLLHGVFCCLVFSILAFTGYMHFFGAGFLMWELSTPMMHLRWVLYKIGKGASRLYSANAMAGMATFFLCRIVWGNVLSLLFWVASYRALQGPRGPELPMSVIWFYRLCTLVMNGLNAWWFSKMVGLLRAALGAKAAAEQLQAKQQ